MAARGLAATNMRLDFHRHGSTAKIVSFCDLVPSVGLVTTEPDERSQLLDHTRSCEQVSTAQRERRSWVHVSANTFRAIWTTGGSNPLNVLLVFVPFGIVAGALGVNSTTVFLLNFLAMIPLASILSFATEELSAKLGNTLGGLVNASFGNAVEMIVSMIALKNNEIQLVQASMLGSILSNLLLVLGCCFLAGGIKHHEQFFNATVASTMSSLLAVASASLIIPATIYETLTLKPLDPQDTLLKISRGTAVILLILYIIYLIFQLKTHSNLFDEENQPEADDQGDAHTLSPWAAGMMIIIVTVTVAICAHYLIKVIDPFVETAHISKTFTGLILIPIIGNAAEHTTAVVVAWKNKMGLAIAVAIGSCLQIALFVTPGLVVLGWIMDRPLSLHFGMFETVAFAVSVFVVVLLIQDGKSNYLEGVLCLALYGIIALAFALLPDQPAGVGGGKVLDNAAA